MPEQKRTKLAAHTTFFGGLGRGALLSSTLGRQKTRIAGFWKVVDTATTSNYN
jgi:hypothetical protein